VVDQGLRSVLKTYPRADTERFKCWGSGALNEAHVRPLLGSVVPTVLSAWADSEAEYVSLERIEADPFDAATASADQLAAAGRMLARIHGTRGTYWGALYGGYRFDDPLAALGTRIGAAVRLLGSQEPDLAEWLLRWTSWRLGAVTWVERPTLVHGDYGPANLLCAEDGLRVIDWEFARWGDPLEDWAMIRFSSRFPDPNGFGPAENLRRVEAGWREIAGRAPPRNDCLEEILYTYYAACLGIFFGGRPNVRIAWLRRFLERQGAM
jgi:aminoglycoside phosphotransferase (APT) family kinase protein